MRQNIVCYPELQQSEKFPEYPLCEHWGPFGGIAPWFTTQLFLMYAFIYLTCHVLASFFSPPHIRRVPERCASTAPGCPQRTALEYGGRARTRSHGCGWGRTGAASSPLSLSVLGEQWWNIRQRRGDWGEIREWRKRLFPQQKEKEKTEGKEREKNKAEKEGWRGRWQWWRRPEGTKGLFILSQLINLKQKQGKQWKTTVI